MRSYKSNEVPVLDDLLLKKEKLFKKI